MGRRPSSWRGVPCRAVPRARACGKIVAFLSMLRTILPIGTAMVFAPRATADPQACSIVMGRTELDGNLVVDTPGNLDWFAGPSQGFLQTGVPCGLPATFTPGTNVKIIEAHKMERDFCNGQGLKDGTVFGSTADKNNSCLVVGLAPWQHKTGDIPAKDDLTEAYAVVYQDLDPLSIPPNQFYLFIAVGHRSNDGDMHLDFEYNQQGVTEAIAPNGESILVRRPRT